MFHVSVIPRLLAPKLRVLHNEQLFGFVRKVYHCHKLSVSKFIFVSHIGCMCDIV